MERSKAIIDQIKADISNIQVMVDMLPHCKKTHYKQVQAAIKTLVREIKYQKELITDFVYTKESKKSIRLFEVEPSEIEQIQIDDISSFFGDLDDMN